MKKGQYNFTLRGIKIQLSTATVPKEQIETHYNFYDPQKNQNTFALTMSNLMTNTVLPLRTNYPCWWCKYDFSNSPIGIPIRYHTDTDVFDTEGIFCSFSCCKAFMLDNPHYKKYLTLLYLLNLKLRGVNVNTRDTVTIKKSPHWKLLEKWGGPLSITEFRNSIVDSQYYATPNIKCADMRITGSYYEKIKV